MEWSSMWSLEGTMFLCVIAGILLQKKKLIPEGTKAALTDLVLNLVLQCNIVMSFQIDFDVSILKIFALIFFLAVLAQVISFVIAKIAYNHYSPDKKKVFQYATLVSNSGFLGNPDVYKRQVFAPIYGRKIFYKENRIEIGKMLRKLCNWK